MADPAKTVDQNLLPVQAYFNLDGSFNTFIGQGQPFYATSNPVQSGLTITSSTIDSTTIGATTPSTGVFTNISTTTGTISTTPSNATDIANKFYVDTVAQGLGPKAACAVGTIVNITLSGLQTIDGYTTVAGDRVLVKNQSSSQFNGIYIASASAWTRSVDMDVWSEVPGAYTVVLNGGQADTGWVCTATQSGTINVTAMPWVQFSGTNTYYAGTGLTLASNTFSITNTGVSASTYGSASVVPVLAVNAQGQITSASNSTISIAPSQINATIPNSGLTNSSITVNGNAIALGGSATITAINPFALTIGTGLTGTSYNGSVATTIAIDSSVVTLSGTQTLTNKTLTAPVISTITNTGTLTLPTSTDTLVGRATSDTLTNKTIAANSNTITGLTNSNLSGTAGITNANLANSSITVNSTSISLGSSGTITANTTNTLTIGTGLSGTSFNGSSAVTIANTGVLSFSAGTTGFTPSTATTGAITLGGTLGLTNGGTNANLTAVAGGAVYSTGTALAITAAGTTGYVLTSNGSSAPTWQAATGGLTISSVTGATTYYPAMATALGATTSEYIDTTNLSYTSGVLTGIFSGNISNGTASHTSITGTGVVTLNTTTNNQSYTTTGAGTITIGSGTTGTINNMSIGATTASTGAFTTVSASGQITSTVTTGTAPFVVSSTTAVANLSIGGNAGSATTATTATNSAISTTSSSATYYPTLVSATTGASLPLNGSASLSYVPSTGVLSATAYTGGWQGSTIGATYGGTGQSSYATGDIIYASATNTLSKLSAGTNGYVLTLASGIPTWAASSGGSAASYTRTSFTATAGQTTFTVSYTVGYVEVYVNGVLLNGADYTATNGTSVVLAVGRATNDIVETIAFATSTVTPTNLSVGTSLVQGGTSGYVLYNNAGVVGNLATTGSGSVVLGTSPTITTAILSSPTINTPTMGGSVITSGTAVASTSGTTISFIGIPSWAKRITVMLNGVSTSGSSRLQIQIGSGTYTTTGYVSSASTIFGGSAATTTATTGYIIEGAGAAEAKSGHIVITLVSGFNYIASHTIGSSAGNDTGLGGGTVTLGGVLDRVRVTTVNGTDTFDAGSINILYE